jgi:hypothetical protein
MQRVGAALRFAATIAWLVACIFTVGGCSDETTDPRQVFGLRDATDSGLLAEIDEAINVANTALAVDGRFALRPTWRPIPGQRAVRHVPVYLLRRPALTIEAGIAKTSRALETFRAELAKTAVPPEFDSCTDTDPCSALMYAGTQMGRLASEVYQSSAAVDAAATEIDCQCVMLIEDDLRKFKLIFGPSIESGEPIVPLAWYVPWYALHEVGHRNSDFVLIPSVAWADLYRRTQFGLNANQKEEMRADAYAASMLGRACLVQQNQEVRETVAQACYGLATMNLQNWFYGLFDKTDDGLRRQYLNDGRTHPNTVMRLLVANVIMTDGGEKAVALLTDFMEKREIFAKRFSKED